MYYSISLTIVRRKLPQCHVAFLEEGHPKIGHVAWIQQRRMWFIEYNNFIFCNQKIYYLHEIWNWNNDGCLIILTTFRTSTSLQTRHVSDFQNVLRIFMGNFKNTSSVFVMEDYKIVNLFAS